ncbi:MAG: hypothetical protein WC707_00675 [Candidatus Babeliaceae bacterium]|jgi:hypothetical protein
MAIIKLSKNMIIEAKIMRLIEENPDLTYEFIKNILIAQQEAIANKFEKYAC